jgi:hypothetical protein
MYQSLLGRLCTLGVDHVATRLVEGVDLLRAQIDRYSAEVADYLVNEGLVFAWLESDKVSPARLCDLDEGVARHVLHAFAR